MIFKWHVQSQEGSSLILSSTVETQYLTFDMTQYGLDGGIFSSTLNDFVLLINQNFYF